MTQQWMPIQTAPKDGEPILVYKGDERRVGPYMTAAYWGEWPDREDGWIAVAGQPLGYFSRVHGAPQGYPTHWMPLPEQPKHRSAITPQTTQESGSTIMNEG